MVKRALLIGINEYSEPKIPNLRGCVNDVEALAAVLSEHYEFEPANLTKLVSRDTSTRQAILSALKRLVQETEPEDVALIYYSGHGSQVPDRSGDETVDRKDETIVPSDSGRTDGRPVLDILDDELETYVGELSRIAANTTFIFDSCHSGSITREVLEPGAVKRALREARPVPRAAPVADEPLAVEVQPYADFDTPQERHRSATGLIPQGDYLLIAGCLDSQTSAELEFEGSPRGLLTYHLVEQLRVGVGSTAEEIFTKTKEKVEREAAGEGESQQPVFEGPPELRDANPFSPVGAIAKAGDPDPGKGGGGGANPPDDPQDPPDPPDPDEEETGQEPGEWDGRFAGFGALGAIGTLTVLGIVFGLLTWFSLDGENGSTKVVMTLTLELVFIGLLLGMVGAYVALLGLRGRLRAVSNVMQATTAPPAAGTKGVPSIAADEIKGIIESIGKMPTARALIVVGGLIIGGAMAFAWDVLPDELAGRAPTINEQPAALTAAVGGKAQFDVGASGTDLAFEWKRNGRTIPWAKSSSTLFIERVTKEDMNDVFTVVVKNGSGVTPSDGAKLTVVKKKGQQGRGGRRR